VRFNWALRERELLYAKAHRLARCIEQLAHIPVQMLLIYI